MFCHWLTFVDVHFRRIDLGSIADNWRKTKTFLFLSELSFHQIGMKESSIVETVLSDKMGSNDWRRWNFRECWKNLAALFFTWMAAKNAGFECLCFAYPIQNIRVGFVGLSERWNIFYSVGEELVCLFACVCCAWKYANCSIIMRLYSIGKTCQG